MHCATLALNWLKFNQWKTDQLLCGGFLVKDLLALVKIGFTANQMNTKLAHIESDPGRRPTESELKDLSKDMVTKVNPLS